MIKLYKNTFYILIRNNLNNTLKACFSNIYYNPKTPDTNCNNYIS